MSDQGTDTFVGVVAVFVVIGLVVNAAGGASDPPAKTTTATTQSSKQSTTQRTSTRVSPSSNIPGGPLLTCPGTKITDRTQANASLGDLRLRVYYNPKDGGRNCAVATRTGGLTSPPGQMTLTLRFADYDGRRWPKLATQRTGSNARNVGAVYLDDTGNKCVSARVRFRPSGGGQQTWVDTGRIGCG